MQPFSPELLSTLVLVCLAWTGITFIAVIIILVIFLWKYCSKCCRPSKSVKPIRRTPSTISIESHSRAITPVPIKPPVDREKTSYDTHTILNDHSHHSNHKSSYQQKEYAHENNDETITTSTTNDVRMYNQRPQKRLYQPVKPMTDIRVIDRHTPYPADVIARDRLMNHMLFPTERKY